MRRKLLELLGSWLVWLLIGVAIAMWSLGPDPWRADQ